ncbi:MAG: sterol desaturase family protein [Methylovulum sp.]|nr:sterol desaturase family protein [Methylovulum sp.]
MEALIRLSTALSLFIIMIGWEYLKPRRALHFSRKQRWPINLGLAALNILIVRITLGSIAYLSAANAAESHYGLLNTLPLPSWVAVTSTLLFLDFAIYCQHIVAHKWPLLWRLHQVHHTDLEFDATTAVRFHPLEIIISMLYKVVCIYLIGADPLAVIAFEIILNGAATFNHSNVNIPETVDKKLRWFIVTPDMHRIHHSTINSETDSNYGFSISCWDRLCKTYVAEPKATQTTMDIGLKNYRQPGELSFLNLLRLPFK